MGTLIHQLYLTVWPIVNKHATPEKGVEASLWFYTERNEPPADEMPYISTFKKSTGCATQCASSTTHFYDWNAVADCSAFPQPAGGATNVAELTQALQCGITNKHVVPRQASDCCKQCSPPCVAGTTFETQACGGTQDRVCTGCSTCSSDESLGRTGW